MTGFMLKDLLVNKRYLQSGGFVLIFYVAYAIFTNYFDFISMVIIILTSMFLLTTFSYDDIAKWNTYALTMPITRKSIVLSKYILTLYVALIGSILCIIIQFLYSIVIKQALSEESFIIIGVCFTTAILFNCLLIPIVIKVGSERARIIILAAVLIPTVLIMLLSKIELQFSFQNTFNSLAPYIPIITIVVTILLFFLSLTISQKIFASKDF